jgi:dTDP-3-amino-3,4,6-trideoxy-alpha-D-glucose transaminase
MRHSHYRAIRHVPFLDLARAHAPLIEEIVGDVEALLETGEFVSGPAVAEFETAFARFCGTKACVGTSSGLDALRIALLAGGLAPGDEVIVPAQTFVATLEAVTQAGGTPVVVDVSADDLCIDPAAVEAALTPRTRAVLPVHLYGQMADVRSLAVLAARAGIDIVEDACQAHGARRDGINAGTAGRAAAFSFYPGKNLGAIGDAGALVTSDGALDATARALREHGQGRKYHHELEGYTARLDTIQALALLRKLPFLERWNEERRRAAALYLEGLAGVGDLVLPPVPAESEPVWHLFVLRTQRPDDLAEHLQASGIGTGRHYPAPVHLTAAYAHLGHHAGSFPVAEDLACRCLSLPIFPGITEVEIEAVVEAIGAYFDG